MPQTYTPVASVDPDMQGGSWPNDWTDKVELQILKEAKSVTLNIPPHFPSSDSSINPSIFKPRHGVAVGVAPPPMPTHPHPGAAASSVMVVAVGPYHCQSGSLITHDKKCAIVRFFARQGSGLVTADFLSWAKDNDARVRSCYEGGSEDNDARVRSCYEGGSEDNDARVRNCYEGGSEDNHARVRSCYEGGSEDNDARVRNCYEGGSLPSSSEDLAKMLLLDGCLLLFAIFLLRSSVAPPAHDDADHEKQFNYLSADMCRNMKQTRLDLLMLSNQIPFFVLTELHERLKDTFFKGIERSIQELALSCFDDIHPPLRSDIKQDKATAGSGTTTTIQFPEVHHLLHLFHWSRVPQDKHGLGVGPNDSSSSSSMHAEPDSHLPCATWFEECQTSFSKQAAPGSSNSSLHLVFERKMMGLRGVMHVPAQHIHGYSEAIFHSLIAFEQSHQQCGLAVTAYSICMARLLQTEADAKLLRERGILAHTHKTDKEIVDLFTGLADEYNNTFYSRDMLDLCKDVAAHHESTVAKAVKWVGLKCFPKQSITFFVIFGALISIATVINTRLLPVILYRFYHPIPAGTVK